MNKKELEEAAERSHRMVKVIELDIEKLEKKIEKLKKEAESHRLWVTHFEKLQREQENTQVSE